MIIKPYISWPKLSKLKVGDRIRFREDAFMVFSDFNHKWVTIKHIHNLRAGVSITCLFQYEGRPHLYTYSITTYEVEI